MQNKVHVGDALVCLRTMPSESVNCIVTSPPYFGLRDYGMTGQIGMEETPEQFIQALVEVFRECRRVLKKDGSLWVNIGDSYASSGKNRTEEQATAKSGLAGGKTSQCQILKQKSKITAGLKPKDLIGIPWMLAFALRADGWYLRQDIIWSKPNPMPESVTDRCSKAHEYIFLLAKSSNYYYDQEAIKKPLKDASIVRLLQQIEKQAGSDRVPGKTNGSMKAVGPGRIPRLGVDTRGGNQGSEIGIPAAGRKNKDADPRHSGSGSINHDGKSGYFANDGTPLVSELVNKKSVWEVTTKGFKDAHFATFPPALITDCIKAGCPPGGVVLDPFLGAFTTLITANKLGRYCVGIELNPDYAAIGMKRAAGELGMFNSIEIVKP